MPACTSATTASSRTSSATSSRAASRWSFAIAAASSRRSPVEPELVALSTEVAQAYDHRFDSLDFTGALEHVWELVRALNRYVETRAPWVLAKSDDPARRRGARRPTLATLCEGVRALAVLLWPYLPSRAPLILAAVGEEAGDVAFERAVIGSGSGRTVDTSGGSLFPRIDAPVA